MPAFRPLRPLWCALFAFTLAGVVTAAGAEAAAAAHVSIVSTGAVGDGRTLATAAIQRAIDQLAAQGGGTVVVPAGVYLSGALFLKPGVNLHLDKDAVLKASTDMTNFPARRTRIEGHFEARYTPGLINAERCDGLQITGEGTLDGSGRPIWDLFWKTRAETADRKNFQNITLPRARLCVLQNCRRVLVQGVTFKDSQFWNLHVYACQDVEIAGVRFEVPDDYRQAPSTDGIDVDSCQRVTIRGCYFSVTDDCIALKGSKGPLALEDLDSPPVEHIRVTDCVFKRGHGTVTLGSEATIVRDVVVEHCRVTGPMAVVCLKLRPDTPQRYEDIHYRDISLDAASGAIFSIRPWTQYFDLKGQPPPKSVVRDITVSELHGRFGAFGTIEGNKEQTEISDVKLADITVQLKSPKLTAVGVKNLIRENVNVDATPAGK